MIYNQASKTRLFLLQKQTFCDTNNELYYIFTSSVLVYDYFSKAQCSFPLFHPDIHVFPGCCTKTRNLRKLNLKLFFSAAVSLSKKKKSYHQRRRRDYERKSPLDVKGNDDDDDNDDANARDRAAKYSRTNVISFLRSGKVLSTNGGRKVGNREDVSRRLPAW